MTEPAWRLERAVPADLPRLVAIAAASFDPPWSEGAFREELALSEASAWVARDARGELRAYLCARRVLDELHLLSLGVEPAVRRRGAATALLEAALGEARAAGVRLAHLEVRAGNAGARAFYARAGFRAVGRRRRYYPDGEDAVLLGAALAPAARGVA